MEPPTYILGWSQDVLTARLRKAGVPERDARGPITSHRARSTIATQLYNAKQPMSLLALKEWLGHRRLESTQWYAAVTPAKLTEAYLDTRYFERNVAVIQVLLDRAVIETGTDKRCGLQVCTPWTRVLRRMSFLTIRHALEVSESSCAKNLRDRKPSLFNTFEIFDHTAFARLTVLIKS